MQQIQQMAKGESGVDDVFHHEHMLAGDGHAQIVRDFDDPRGLGGGTVATHAKEITADISIHGAHEIRHEYERATQDPHDVNGALGKGTGDLVAQRGHAGSDFHGGKELMGLYGRAQGIIFPTDSSSSQDSVEPSRGVRCP